MRRGAHDAPWRQCAAGQLPLETQQGHLGQVRRAASRDRCPDDGAQFSCVSGLHGDNVRVCRTVNPFTSSKICVSRETWNQWRPRPLKSSPYSLSRSAGLRNSGRPGSCPASAHLPHFLPRFHTSHEYPRHALDAGLSTRNTKNSRMWPRRIPFSVFKRRKDMRRKRNRCRGTPHPYFRSPVPVACSRTDPLLPPLNILRSKSRKKRLSVSI